MEPLLKYSIAQNADHLIALKYRKPVIISEYERISRVAKIHILKNFPNKVDHEVFVEIAERTDADISMLHDFVQANLFSKRNKISEKYVYALIRADMFSDTEQLLFSDVDDIMDAVYEMSRQNIISLNDEEDAIENFAEQMVLMKVQMLKSEAITTFRGHKNFGSNLHSGHLNKRLQAEHYLMCVRHIQAQRKIES